MESQIVKIFLGLCSVLSGSTNVAKRLDVIVYPGNIRRVTGHARAECATSIRFQLITARTWAVSPSLSFNPSYNLRSNFEYPYICLMLDSDFDYMTMPMFIRSVGLMGDKQI
ncbi:Uncharacterized protein OBRU01_18008 [Operophtera brumata]|uniref:Uncharacterized protein n=1 Tax=Operophtera brumata TaxID=104452 RepID=A0A0L7L038_OPEBR|nr:Uncharacterized protein OBRU01_18008 [Operophtera brumata]